MIRNFFGKYWLSIMAGFMAFFTPLREVFLFVGILVIADWITGIAKGLKTNTFTSAKCIIKLWTSLGYFISIVIAKSIEDYTHLDAIVKAIVGIIAISEIQSLRENIIALTKVDILKPIMNIFNNTNKQNEKIN
jgi:phage-related holin